jgi:phosphatidylinositol alpha-1,6-mannosyltransferase
VGFVTHRIGSQDGWGRYSAGLIGALVERGLQGVVVSSTLDQSVVADGIEHHRILPPPFQSRFGSLQRLLYIGRLRSALASCDLVHCLIEPYLPLVALSLRADQPLVATAHGTWTVAPLAKPTSRWLHELALGRVDLLLCQSAYTRSRLQERLGLPMNRLMPAGVDLEVFGQVAATTLPVVQADDQVVLSVGALKPRKGFEFALDAVAAACEKVEGLQYVVVGEGASDEPGDRLRLRAEALGISAHLHLEEGVPQEVLAGLYRRAAVFMLLPVNMGDAFEGLGLAYLEAAAAGTPCIGTHDCGAQEAIIDGRTGLLVHQGDSDDAAGALIRLLSDGALLARMGDEARMHARRYDWRSVAEELLCNYSELIECKR